METDQCNDSTVAVESNKCESDDPEDVSYKLKVCRTVVLYAGFFTLGIAWAIIGPTLLDLELLTDSSTESISLVFMGRSVGGLIGAILSGFLMELFNNWLLLAGTAFALALGLGNVTAPWSRSLGVLFFWQVVLGITGGFYDAGGNVTLLSIWGKDNGPWMQALHLLFGVGTLFAPLVAEPFLAKEVTLESCQDGKNETIVTLLATEPGVTYPASHSSTSEFSTSVSPSCTEMGETRVMYAYLITGCLILCIAVALSVIFWTSDRQIRKPRPQPDAKKEKRSPKHERVFTYIIVFLVCWFYLFHCMLEILYGNYIMTFAVKFLKWTKTMGATLNSVYWGVYSITRGCGIIMIKFLKPQTMLFGSCCIILISLIPMLFLVTEHAAVFWVCSLGVAVGISLLFPTGISWAEQYINVAGRYGSVFMVGAAGGELIGPPVVGALFVKIGPMAFIYVAFTIACLVFIVFCTMALVASKHGSRYEAPSLVVIPDDESNRELQPMNLESNHVPPVDV